MAPARRPSGDPLGAYRAKRNFASTPEPDGTRPAASTGDEPRFLVQRHRARRLHYDLRLEMDGTLVSWAVPKGPTLDPARRSLAVHVEDHPFDYGWFEGVIAEGYGAGDVIVWDDGWWEMDPTDERDLSPREAVSSGELKFLLHGRKLERATVIDLASALEASLAAAKESRTRHPSARATKPAAKKAQPAKKAPAAKKATKPVRKSA